jgi:glycolate oxidase FAD binding subunit
VEWGGSQRWVYTNIPVNLIRNIAHKGSGHATVYRGSLPGVIPISAIKWLSGNQVNMVN